MNAHVLNGKAALWSGPLPSSFDGHFVPVVDDPQPELSGEQVIEPGELAIDYAGGEPVQVRRTWTVRQKTAAEAQKTWEQLTLIENLSDEELLSLEDICLPGHPARATGVRIRAALLGAVETYSRTSRTKTFIGAAIQLGIVADIDRARVILGDPGFSLE